MKKPSYLPRILLFLGLAVLGWAVGSLLRSIFLGLDAATVLGVVGGALLTLGCVLITMWFREQQQADERYRQHKQRQDALTRMRERAQRLDKAIEQAIADLGDDEEDRVTRFRLRDEQAGLWQFAEEAEQGDRDPDTVAVTSSLRSSWATRQARDMARGQADLLRKVSSHNPQTVQVHGTTRATSASPADSSSPRPAGAPSTDEPQFLQPILIPLLVNTPTEATTPDRHCTADSAPTADYGHHHTSSDTSSWSSSDSGCSSSDSGSSSSSDSGSW